ncbi:MAG: hypothetical protein P9F19_15925 [Candidatus Contendobacter sp.]|nr:hypothetical protein [Candidatus Contendobacter sp.]MDG4558860.1 hypothetical protein [Candidatus Contendobacter sp.]
MSTPFLQQMVGNALFAEMPLQLAEIAIGLFDGSNAELSGGGYQRVRHDPGESRWSSTQVDGKTRFTNLTPVTFGAPTTNWGTAAAVGYFSGGELLAAGPIAPRVIEAGDHPPVFLAGELVFEIE